MSPRWLSPGLLSWFPALTHWGWVKHIWVGNLTIIGSDNGLSAPQAIIWTNAWILLIGPLGTNFGEILIGIQIFSYKKLHLKTSSAKWRLFCLGLNELMWRHCNKFRENWVSIDDIEMYGCLIFNGTCTRIIDVAKAIAAKWRTLSVYHFSASATAGPCLDNIVGSCESDAAVAKFAYRYLCLLEYQGEITIQQVTLTSADTRRKNNVIMTSKRRRDLVLMSKWRYYCALCPLERSESTAIQWRRINVSNHRQLDCIPNRFLGRILDKHQNLIVLCWGESSSNRWVPLTKGQ